MEAGSLDGQVAVDIAAVDSIDQMIAVTRTQFGDPTILVNNAGHARFAFALDMTEEEWDCTHSICTRGTFFASRRAARVMAAAGYGRILNLSSMTAPLGHARYAGYSSAKGAIGTPAEVADAALFLCRPDAEWITGTVLSIDGGYTAHGATEAREVTSHPAIKKESTA